MDQLLQRAFAAYLKFDGAAAAQPIATCSGVQQLDGLKYVVLANRNRVCAVYRIKNDGSLRRMRRWPMELGWVGTDSAVSSARPRGQEHAHA
jgi:hypothetical protein